MATPMPRRQRKIPQRTPTLHGIRATCRVWLFVTAHPQASFREMCAELGLSSTSVARYHVLRLERLGYIEHDPKVARGRRILVPYMSVQVKRREVADGPAR